MTSPTSHQDLSAPISLIEVAWETCNKVGGIYTVLSSKAAEIAKHFGSAYLLIGPWNQQEAEVEFEADSDLDSPVAKALALLARKGIRAYSGRWLIPGEPRVVLFDLASVESEHAHSAYLLWQHYGIEGHHPELHRPTLLGYCVAEFLLALSVTQPGPLPTTHFHEWQAGVGLLLKNIVQAKNPSIFTTHATILGRYLASADPHYHHKLAEYDSDFEATRLNIGSLHQVERSCAHAADIFSTVSHTTSEEAYHLLGRAASKVLPNGLPMQQYTAVHEFQNLHLECKLQINEFISGHFFPSYTFDLENTLYIFTSGRYEYLNKGMDVFIEALVSLNNRLKAIPGAPTVVAFIVTSASHHGISNEVLRRQLVFREVRDTCSQLSEEIEEALLHHVTQQQLPSLNQLISREVSATLKRSILAFRSHSLPSIVTHELPENHHDPVLNHLRDKGLWNQESDKVKVVFHPEFISAGNPLFGLDYEEFVRGCHLGIFPSLYEPWGYTPLECLALGIPAVTSDLSGFGGYALEHSEAPESEEFPPLLVARRQRTSTGEAAEEIANHLQRFCMLSQRERIQVRNRSEAMSQNYDWAILASRYLEAYRELQQ